MAQNPPAAPAPESSVHEPVHPRHSLRVLHLHAGNMMGGIESILLSLADCASLSPKLKQSFALTFDSTLAVRLRAKKTPVYLLPQVRLRHPPSIYQSRRQLRMLLDEVPFDAIVSHSPWIQLIFADVVRSRRIPLVYWMHGPYNGHWLQKLASIQKPDFALCNSHWTRSTLERLYRVPSAVIYCPVQPISVAASREELRATLGVSAEEVLILAASRIERGKGYHVLLQAIGKISSSTPYKLLIAGAPNSSRESRYFESLQQQAKASGIADRVRFLGYRTDIPALISAADLYCQANTYPDAFGVAFVEALQGGVPVVTSSIGGAREILDRKTGILVPPGDVDGFARALSQLIENPALRSRMGSEGPTRAEALCDPARQMRMLTETVESVIHRVGGLHPR